VIFEVPKINAQKSKFSRTPLGELTGGAYIAPQNFLLIARGLAAPSPDPNDPTPVLGPSIN